MPRMKPLSPSGPADGLDRIGAESMAVQLSGHLQGRPGQAGHRDFGDQPDGDSPCRLVRVGLERIPYEPRGPRLLRGLEAVDSLARSDPARYDRIRVCIQC